MICSLLTICGFAYILSSLSHSNPKLWVLGLLLRHHIATSSSAGILTCCPSDYAFQPLLRSWLTQGGRAFPWNPSMFGVQDSHLHFVTYAGILTSKHSTIPSGIASTPFRTLFYQYNINVIFHSFGDMFSPVTFSAHIHSTSELLRTL